MNVYNPDGKSSNIIKEVKVNVLSNKKCKKIHKNIDKTRLCTKTNSSKKMKCDVSYIMNNKVRKFLIRTYFFNYKYYTIINYYYNKSK